MQNIWQKATLAFVAMSVVGSGCATMKVDKPSVEAVKTVAVIGYGVQQRMPNTGEGVVKALLAPKDPTPSIGGMPALKPVEIAKPSDHVARMYENLDRELHLRFKWKVISREKLDAMPVYQALLREKTKMPQMRPMASGPNLAAFTPPGVVEDFLLASMSAAERQALIKQLGVDAIAIAGVKIELTNEGGLKKLVGAGEFHPKASLTFKVYDAQHEDPIWMDQAVEGEPTAEGTEHALGFANVDALNAQAILAVDSAYQKLIARYSENK